MKKVQICLLIAGLASAPIVAYAQVPALLPVQGLVSDETGVPIDGPADLTFALYDLETSDVALHIETQSLDLLDGVFTAYVGADPSNPLDLTIFQTGEIYLGVAAGSDPEMRPRVRLGMAPYAAFAQACRDASMLDGNDASSFAPVSHTHAFDDLTDVPADLADGDDDTTYSGARASSSRRRTSSAWTLRRSRRGIRTPRTT